MDVRLLAGRVSVHASVVVALRPVPPALVWRRVQGAARRAVLVVGRVRGRHYVPAPGRRPHTEAQQEAGHHVAAERGRAVRVHDVHHVRDRSRVPGADDAAFGGDAGRRVSTPATSPRYKHRRRARRLAVAFGSDHRRFRRFRARHVLRAIYVKVNGSLYCSVNRLQVLTFNTTVLKLFFIINRNSK